MPQERPKSLVEFPALRLLALYPLRPIGTQAVQTRAKPNCVTRNVTRTFRKVCDNDRIRAF